jgi:uncharacterized protein (TIGR00369 family)
MPQEPLMTVETMNERIRNALFNSWLGARVVEATRDSIELHVEWRDEMFGNPDTGAVHGGVLAAIVDVAASYGVAAATGRIGATLDMRVDYHRAAKPGPMIARTEIVKAGRTINTVDVRLSDVSGKLVCSGRAVYFLSNQ